MINILKGGARHLPKEASSILKSFKPLVKSLGKTLGKHYEIVLHDITQLESSIIAIENGHITGRKLGGPSTNFLLDIINSKGALQRNMEVNYTTQTKDGRKLKCTTTLIRDEVDNIVGALCINFDLTHINIAKNFLEELSLIEQEEAKEQFPENVNDFLDTMIQNSLDLVDKPIPMLSKEDKLKIVKYLDDNNIFNIKRGVDTLANVIKVSKYTIYNYLDEIRAQ